MVDRLRALLEDPRDPAAARAVVLLASAVTIGLAVLIGLGGVHGGRSTYVSRSSGPGVAATSPAPMTRARAHAPRVRRHTPRPQDPQDRPGTRAARRARRELASHRALQHVPFRHDEVTITLVGADGTRAVLRIEAASLPDARRGWRRFLRRYRDDGRAYQPRFEARRRR